MFAENHNDSWFYSPEMMYAESLVSQRSSTRKKSVFIVQNMGTPATSLRHQGSQHL